MKVVKNVKKSKQQKSLLSVQKKFIGDKYDYSKVEYIDSNTNICLIYNGDIFYQNPRSFLKGCNYYSIYKKLTTEEFIKRAKEVHGDKYDYSKVEYINSKTKVCIICPKHR